MRAFLSLWWTLSSPREARSRLELCHVHCSHHPHIFMVKDMAVLDRLADKVSELHAESDATSARHVDRVAPRELRLPIRTNHLKWVHVKVHRVIHAGLVDVIPILDSAQRYCSVNAVGVKRPSVDQKTHHPSLAKCEAASHAGRRQWGNASYLGRNIPDLR